MLTVHFLSLSSDLGFSVGKRTVQLFSLEKLSLIWNSHRCQKIVYCTRFNPDVTPSYNELYPAMADSPFWLSELSGAWDLLST
jgi:hypothetical protein